MEAYQDIYVKHFLFAFVMNILSKIKTPCTTAGRSVPMSPPFGSLQSAIIPDKCLTPFNFACTI